MPTPQKPLKESKTKSECKVSTCLPDKNRRSFSFPDEVTARKKDQFTFWGYPEEKVYVDKPENFEQLKENNTREIWELNLETLTRNIF